MPLFCFSIWNICVWKRNKYFLQPLKLNPKFTEIAYWILIYANLVQSVDKLHIDKNIIFFLCCFIWYLNDWVWVLWGSEFVIVWLKLNLKSKNRGLVGYKKFSTKFMKISKTQVLFTAFLFYLMFFLELTLLPCGYLDMLWYKTLLKKLIQVIFSLQLPLFPLPLRNEILN